MTLVAAIPGLSALVYGGLIVLLLRQAGGRRDARAFAVYLAVLATQSGGSLAWALAGKPDPSGLLSVVVTAGLLAGPALLFFVQRRAPQRGGQVSPGVAIAAAVIVVGVMGGALERTLLGGGPASSVDYALAVAATVAMEGCYVCALWLLARAYRGAADPVERNRLKLLMVAALSVVAGGHTNILPALREVPLDQAINAAAAGLIAYSLLRYRLFNVDVVLRRGIVVAAIALLVSPSYWGLLMAIERVCGVGIDTPAGFVLSLLVGFPAWMFARGAGLVCTRLVDRFYVGRRRFLAGEAMIARFSRDAMRLRDRSSLAREIALASQGALQSRYGAVLLPDAAGAVLQLEALHGPFPVPQPEWTIRADGALARALTQEDAVVTPARLRALLDTIDLPPHERAEIAPYRDCLLAPIVARGRLMGLIAVAPPVFHRAYRLEELDLLETLTVHSALALENALLFEQLRHRAETDALTELPNHRRLRDLMDRLLAQARAREEPMSVVMVDIDNFKLLNDVYGHLTGDEALRQVARMLRSAMGTGQIVGRYGGDEFLCLLPRTTAPQADAQFRALARDIRKVALRAPETDAAAAAEIPARISFGVSAYPESGESWQSLVSAADGALLERRFQLRRAGTVAARSSVARVLGDDPKRLRITNGLLDLIDAKDPYTSEHSQQVASLALLLARELELPERERFALWLGGLLHDVGKLVTPQEVLRKPGRLNDDEWGHIRDHPQLGEQIVRDLLELPDVAEIVGAHHERFDGRGYPRALAGERVPRLARLIAVVDAFSAMVHDRPYRKGLAWDEAAEELRRHAGSQFDPLMVEAFRRALARGNAAIDLDDRAA